MDVVLNVTGSHTEMNISSRKNLSEYGVPLKKPFVVFSHFSGEWASQLFGVYHLDIYLLRKIRSSGG